MKSVLEVTEMTKMLSLNWMTLLFAKDIFKRSWSKLVAVYSHCFGNHEKKIYMFSHNDILYIPTDTHSFMCAYLYTC